MRYTCAKHAVYQGVKQGCDTSSPSSFAHGPVHHDILAPASTPLTPPTSVILFRIATISPSSFYSLAFEVGAVGCGSEASSIKDTCTTRSGCVIFLSDA